MFLGHFAVAIAAKRAAPRQSLGSLFFAAQFADLLWPTLLLVGVERMRIDADATPIPLIFEYYPYSHSLLALVIWGVLIGGAVFVATRDRMGAVVVAALVASHWALDLIVHGPDLPLAPGGDTRLGLSLWSSNATTMLLELVLLAVALGLYFRMKPEQIKRASMWVLIVLLVALAWWADRSPRQSRAVPV